jgi:DNA-binding NarL/FixJ family response regulator
VCVLSSPTPLAYAVAAGLAALGWATTLIVPDGGPVDAGGRFVIAIATGDRLPPLRSARSIGGRVVAVGDLSCLVSLTAAVERGVADAVVNSELPLPDLLETLHRQLTNPPPTGHLIAELRRRLAETERFSRLSPRETEILAGLVSGESATGLAGRYVVSLATVRTQIRSILIKLDVTSQREAVTLAQRSCAELGVRRAVTALHQF